MEKEGFFFKQAINYLVNRYKIDISSVPDITQIELKDTTIKKDDKKVLFKTIHNNLLSLRKKLPFEKYKNLCAVYFMTRYQDHQEMDVLDNLKKIEEKLIWLSHQST
jgi:hypothetical protein